MLEHKVVSRMHHSRYTYINIHTYNDLIALERILISLSIIGRSTKAVALVALIIFVAKSGRDLRR